MGRKINVNIRFTEITIRSRIRVYCISADHSVEFTNRCIPKWCSCVIIADVREKETFSALRCVIYRPSTRASTSWVYIYIYSILFHRFNTFALIYWPPSNIYDSGKFGLICLSICIFRWLLSCNKTMNFFIDGDIGLKINWK